MIVEIERASKIIDHLTIVAAGLADEHDLAAGEDTTAHGSLLVRAERAARLSTPSPAFPGTTAGSEELAETDENRRVRFRNCTEYLRATLGISRFEAKRRLSLADAILPTLSPSGAPVPPRRETLAAAMNSCLISTQAGTVILRAVQRVESFTTPSQLESMEQHLTQQAIESDEDILRVVARRWEGFLDQDGLEPTDKVLQARQGVFLKGRRHGLHVLEIGATDDQFERLVTVMNSTANPRAQEDSSAGSTQAPSAARNGPTRAQGLLDGLMAACSIVLSTTTLPATGGHRPQVMVTIDYKDLIGITHRPGHSVFTQQISAQSIRKLACDADLIPLVLGGEGQVLDVGRAQRLFPPHLRRALVARDGGCAFPDCSIPASWCEAHHLQPWSNGGSTSIDNGVLLCSRHHHVLHQGSWTVEARKGVPWFRSPNLLGREPTVRRNTYWQAGRAVRERLDPD